MSFLVISSSLNPASRSRSLAERAAESLRARDAAVDFVDLREKDLPHCDAGPCYEHAEVQRLSEQIRDAEGVLLATPIYNYSASSSVVNLIELTGQAWTEKVVGFLCAAGGAHSYMSVMGLANSLMLDFRSIVIPRFVYSDETAFEGNEITDTNLTERLDELAGTLIRVGRALNGEGARGQGD